MITEITMIKDLPKDIKLTTANRDNEEIFICEYTLATLIYNRATLNQLLEIVNEIEDKKEKQLTKETTINMVLEFINLNPEYVYLVNDSDAASAFLNLIRMVLYKKLH
jgi:MinD-like ATPase involved in chromosome partitioning or flagellar assembly